MSNDQKINNNNEDTYDILHKKFSLFGDDEPVQVEEEDVKNSGEIYFSANSNNAFNRNNKGNISFSDDGQNYDWSKFETPSKNNDRPFRNQTGQNTPAYYAEHGAFRTEESEASARKIDDYDFSEKLENNGKTQRQSAKPENKKAQKQNKKNRSVLNAADEFIEGKIGKNNKRRTGWVLAIIILIVVVTVSMIIRVPIMGCINDILAINGDNTEIWVVVEPNMNTNDVIDMLAKKHLLYSATFCKFAYEFLGHDPEEIYPAGTYTVSSKMGLEGMMKEIITAGQKESTVSITFPEGYTVDQIIEKLAANGVASSSALYGVIDSVEFIESYEFLSYIQDREQRYHYLEGYLYPDTYEFYVGENPQSVINRFLKNFSEKWAEHFSSRCDKFSYTMDEVLTVASILEKEAKDADQMHLVASILYNRLESSSFQFINCDSTAKYVENQKDKLVSQGRYASLLKVYDTYQITGLPVGPICNPGFDSIDAALSPDNTDYYYFIHDSEGKIYAASTLAEHQANMMKAGIN